MHHFHLVTVLIYFTDILDTEKQNKTGIFGK